MSLESLQQRLGYTFRDPGLLRQALTHRSHGQPNNERLEFLGDSVLNCAVASLLYDSYGKLDEGDLSRLRSNLVKQQSLYEIAQKLELSQLLLLGEGELKSGGFRRPSILGDTVEAIFGAVFLDGGFDAADAVIGALYRPILKAVDPKTLGKDAKTLLQEYLQGQRVPLPVYAVVATHGAAHNQQFEVECSIPKLGIQVLGGGGSRRAAEQAAAKLALERAHAVAPAPSKRTRSRATAPVTVTVVDAGAVAAGPAGGPAATHAPGGGAHGAQGAGQAAHGGGNGGSAPAPAGTDADDAQRAFSEVPASLLADAALEERRSDPPRLNVQAA